MAYAGKPVASDKMAAASILPQPRFTHLLTVPSDSTAPGTPRPMPAQSSRLIPALEIISVTRAATSGSIFLPLSDLSVAEVFLIIILSFSSMIQAIKDVPPISIPIEYFISYPVIH